LRFLGLVALFLVRLFAGDPSRIPSALIGHPAPQTDLAAGRRARSQRQAGSRHRPASFKGAVTVVNVWASWCVPCHDEAPLLMQLAQDSRLRVIGINYKDEPENARRFLGRYGNPFAAAGADRQRPRRDRMGRLWRAGDVCRRPRRPHRLQAGRPDHPGQF
jgi:cytochrome c biogenesis protein CcmG/thiol:disulfide interchange protein DsbE